MRPTRRSVLATGGAAAAAAALPGAAGAQRPVQPQPGAGGRRLLRLFNWDTYLGPNTLDEFSKATGVDVAMDFYASNDELLAVLQKGEAAYDLVVPSDRYVTRMVRQGLLAPIDHARLPNLSNLDPTFTDLAFDPGMGHSVPYTTLLQGLGTRRAWREDGLASNSWSVLFADDHELDRAAILQNPHDAIAVALLHLGEDPREMSPRLIGVAQEALADAFNRGLRTHEDNGQDILASGECDIVMEYNGDISMVREDFPDTAFSFPREGALIATDNFCIPASAPSPDLAYLFIDFILDADVGAGINDSIGYTSPNQAARRKQQRDSTKNLVLYPSASVLANAIWLPAVSEDIQQAMDRALTAALSSARPRRTLLP
jgi:spermidine/putrescine transport system substrate-binding protein